MNKTCIRQRRTQRLDAFCKWATVGDPDKDFRSAFDADVGLCQAAVAADWLDAKGEWICACARSGVKK